MGAVSSVCARGVYQSVTQWGEVPCQYTVRGVGRMRWGPCPPCVPEVLSKVLPSRVKYFVSTEVFGGREGFFCVSVGWLCPPCVPEVCSKVLPSSVKYFVSTEVFGGRELSLIHIFRAHETG